ncbi:MULTISPECIES: DUF5058 family protein [Fusobacterium]|jgi:hypothetical protein|uniref:DUF5058 family protein n=1 Tax=Fusobacterium hominis TaxID=2764326 RepID=A0A7G9GUY3_9FUSO|nr:MULTISPECIES: DUF5058 family protein [Fusobacterium]QNM14615.1 DUF5058 family protein [Fusobacterium hominis]
MENLNQWFYAKHPLMWLIAIFGVLLTLVQSTLIMRKAIKAGYELGITKEEMHKGIRTSAIASIGPSLGVVGSLLALLVTMGSAISYVRLSLIGGANYEAMAANFGAKVLNSELSPNMIPVVFTNALWTMGLGLIGVLVFVFLFAHKMDKVNSLLTNGRKALLPAVSLGAMLGSFAFFNIDNVLKYKTNPSVTFSTIFGGIVMFVCMKLADKFTGLRWLRDWSLTLSMFLGAIFSTLLSDKI